MPRTVVVCIEKDSVTAMPRTVLVLIVLGITTYTDTTYAAKIDSLISQRSENMLKLACGDPDLSLGACSDMERCVHCYLCGKVADHKIIFDCCCDDTAECVEFCHRLLE